MKDQYEVEGILVDLLSENHELCNLDDMALYDAFARKINPLVKGLPFSTVMKNRVELGLPAIASMSRCRRKISEKYPDLRPNDSVAHARVRKMEEMIEYAES